MNRGSYLRSYLKGDVLYNFYLHRDIYISFAKKSGSPTKINDELAQQMLERGFITDGQKAAYEEKVCRSFDDLSAHDDSTVEEVYRHIHSLRREMLGVNALEQIRECLRQQGVEFTAGPVDQTAKKQDLVQKSSRVIFVLQQPELYGLMRRELENAQKLGKEIYIVASPRQGDDLPSRQTLEQWFGGLDGIHYLQDTDRQLQDACLLYYGEEGLLRCRALACDAVVTATPKGYYAQAVVNQLGVSRGCVVYIPRGFDITRYVGLKTKTQLSYWQLSRLWQDFGDSIYALTPEQLYRAYPAYFINIYENGSHCPEAAAGYPIRIAAGEDATRFEQLREQAITDYLGSLENVDFVSAYFDENLKRSPICWDAGQKQPGILVQSVKVKKAQGSQVISCGKGTTPRQKFAALGLPGTGIVSNFLFFLTPKLGVLYNDLRADRPYEQADVMAGHLDYMLAYRDGKRVETFPLFRKTCIAMKENGEFMFFNFRLGGGKITLADTTVSWGKENVDTGKGDVQVYTPYYSMPDADADRATYRKAVGAGRVNLVILQDRLAVLRNADVILPSVGAVISLDQTQGQALIDRLGLHEMADGYYDTGALELTITLDPPESVSKEDWAQIKWAYGGGLSLILDGEGLCDGDHMDDWFAREGWKSPLSRQTQESTLHQLVKHPRTAIGTTADGSLVILVYSGRTWRSTGADYREMISIARQLYPDIRCLMNVDGGGSAMLGMVHEGSFMELSCPSTSTGSTVGMVRPVNTVLYIPAQ